MAVHRLLGEATTNLAPASSPVVLLVSGTVTLKLVFLNVMKTAVEAGNAAHRSPPHNLVHIFSVPVLSPLPHRRFQHYVPLKASYVSTYLDVSHAHYLYTRVCNRH